MEFLLINIGMRFIVPDKNRRNSEAVGHDSSVGSQAAFNERDVVGLIFFIEKFQCTPVTMLS